MSKFEKATVIISVDDGRKDAYRLYKEILMKYNIPATFNIVTAWIDTSNNPDGNMLTLNELKEMGQSELCEIAAHGHTHINDDEDMIKAKELLCEWLETEEKIGFASPGSDMQDDFIKQNGQKFYDMGFLYVRTGRTTRATSEKHIRAIEKAKKMGLCDYAIEYSKQLMYEYDSMCVNSAIVLNYNSVEELKQLTSLAIEEKACILFMLHGVTQKGESDPDDLWCFDFDKCKDFIKHLSELKKQGEIDVLTTKQAYLRGRK